MDHARRSVLQAAMGGAAVFAVGSMLRAPAARAAASTSATTTTLTDKVALVSGCGGNVVALAAGDGLLVVDSGAPHKTSDLQRELAAIGGSGRVTTLFNTHRHLDQTGGNESFGSTGAVIVAHEKCKLWLATDHYVPQEERYEKARPKAALPTKTFYTTGTLTAGNQHVEYGYLLEAHTDGDAYVFFRDANVLAVGDAASPLEDPSFDWYGGGWLGGRLDSLDLLLKLANDDTKIVASTGGVIGKAELAAERESLQKVFDRVFERIRKGESAQDMLEAGVAKDIGRELRDPQKFLYDVYKGFWAHHNNLSHDIV